MSFPKIKMNREWNCGIKEGIPPFEEESPVQRPEESTSGGFPWNG